MVSPTPNCGCPSMMIAASAEVPPMSRLMQRLMPLISGDVSGADHAGRRPGQDHLHALALALLGRHHARRSTW
jgi:hypothetical protein